MKYRQLGKSGIKVSVIGFGGIPIQRISYKEAEKVVNKALDMGINFFDTARGYTDSEAKLGQVLKKRRSESIIATKSMARSREEMSSDIKLSLETLGVDYIDLYQLHNVKDQAALEKVFGPGGAMEALQEARKDGLIKHIGITGHIPGILVEALKNEELETVQFPFNAVEVDGSSELMKLAEKQNVGLIIMKPLAGGALTNTSLALKFILSHPVGTVIPGMDSEEQVEKNAAVADGEFEFSEEEKKILAEETEKLGTSFCRRCEYCQPCPQNVNIPMIFLLDGYYTRYDLKSWANERYKTLPARIEDCVQCGQCEEKCPYDLPIRKMLIDAGKRLTAQ
ncbi:MAG: aldo/keto reductase [Desulfotomaculum sp.]|nr:aldo/keto reductase [Desulfotomaculum sp.]